MDIKKLNIIQEQKYFHCEFVSELNIIKKVVNFAILFLESKAISVDYFALKLCLVESLTNAVIHGNNRDASLKVDLRIRITPSCLKIEIKDEGDGFDWQGALKKEFQPFEQTSGRGILLLKAYCFNPVYNEKGNHLTLTIQYKE